MAELLRYQWELGGLVFGYGTLVEHEQDVAPSDYSVRTEDQLNPGRDGMTMGTDLLEPGVWQFKLFVNTDDEQDALDALSTLKKVWRADAYRKNPGEATTLRYRLGSQPRVVFGRPRRFTAPLGVDWGSGMIQVTADFQTVSELFYDDYESFLDVNFGEPETGGFTAPVEAPITTEQRSGPILQPNTFAVGGELPTPAVQVDFKGPLDRPGLLIDGKPFIQFQKDIPDDVTITVDAQPWVTAVRRSDGGGAAGLLSPRSRMPAMTLEPGIHSATLLGSSPTGGGTARVRWRSAYPSV